MAITANTVETYDNARLIREDLGQAYSMITPMEMPFQAAVGTGEKPTATYHEWSVVDLQAIDTGNRVIEGEQNPAIDLPTLGKRRGNHTQISDKVASVSHTAEAVDAAADNIQRMAGQIMLKLKELKRDKEMLLLSNVAGSAGASGTARATAGLPNFIRTNITLGAGGAAATLSDGTGGFPNSLVVPGTAVPFTEPMLNNLIQAAWEAGGSPTMVLVGANNKRKISNTFTGNSTRYKDSIDKKLVAAVDVYDSDFGEMTIVPTRYLPTLAALTYPVYILDPDLISVNYLENVKQTPLAKTGHADQRLIWCEYTLRVDNEAGLAMHAATTGT